MSFRITEMDLKKNSEKNLWLKFFFMKINIIAIFNSNFSFYNSCSTDMNINDFSDKKPKFNLKNTSMAKQRHGECFMIDLKPKRSLRLIL